MSVDLPTAVSDIVQNEGNPLRAFLRLEELYRMADAEQRAAIREGWPFGRDWSVPGPDYSDFPRVVFAPLVGNDADGLDAQARIEARLTCHAISTVKGRVRDALMDFCLCYHTGLRAGLDVASLFGAAARISDDETASLLRGFVGRNPKDKSLWAFGVREELSEDCIAFQWIGNDSDYDALKPKHLDDMGREVEG